MKLMRCTSLNFAYRTSTKTQTIIFFRPHSHFKIPFVSTMGTRIETRKAFVTSEFEKTAAIHRYRPGF